MRQILIALTMLPLGLTAQTIEECQQAAERNYPLIRQYDLIGKTTQLTVDNIQKGWLPQVSASAQATLQSDVAAWPAEMENMMKQMGGKKTSIAWGLTSSRPSSTVAPSAARKK